MASLVSLFLGKKETKISRLVDGGEVLITLDCMKSEELQADAEVTQHPVEDDADISDHVILRPKALNIDGEVTNTPLNLQSSLNGLINSGLSTIGSTIGKSIGANKALTGLGTGLAGKAIAGLLGLNGEDRMLIVQKELEAARQSRLPCKIQTGLTQYENMILKNYRVRREAGSGGKVMVSLSFIEAIRTSSKKIRIPVPKIKSAVGKQDQGQKTADGIDATEQGKKSSLLFKGIKGIAG